jgi:predicted ferric reductase
MWAGEVSIRRERLTTGKAVLVAVIAVTSVIPLFFVQPDEAAFHINVYKYLAKTGAFVGSMLLIWQFFLGFRGAVSSIFPDLSWVVDLHKALGQYGVLVILLHPIFIGLYYADLEGINIYALDLGQDFSQLVLLGMVLLGLIAFIAISSAFFRGRLGFYRWLYTHLSSYLVPPFLLVHSFALGQTIQGTGLRYYWWFVTVVMIAFYLYRIAHKLGARAARYRVVRTRVVADSTTEIRLQPQGRQLRPAPGQFVYLRGSIPENSHPYTVSVLDEESGILGVTVKEEGPQTTRLQRSQEGDSLLLDGPYGVFTRISLSTDLPLVMLAGGIGITPFRRVWQRLEHERDREVHLVYGNETYSEIAYRDELDALEHVQVVHVLNDEPDFPGEKGLVTVDVLRRNLPQELAAYQFLICGPPVMIVTLEEALTAEGVPDSQVSHELFSS